MAIVLRGATSWPGCTTSTWLSTTPSQVCLPSIFPSRPTSEFRKKIFFCKFCFNKNTEHLKTEIQHKCRLFKVLVFPPIEFCLQIADVGASGHTHYSTRVINHTVWFVVNILLFLYMLWMHKCVKNPQFLYDLTIICLWISTLLFGMQCKITQITQITAELHENILVQWDILLGSQDIRIDLIFAWFFL